MNIRKILKHYWPHIKRYPKTGITVFVAYGIGATLSHTVQPIIYKNIIDTVSGAADRASAAPHLWFLLVLLAVLMAGYNIAYRIADYSIVYFQSNVLRDLSNYTFENLHRHSYRFFTGQFSGSLTTKTKRFIRSFETIHDKVVFSLFYGGLTLFGSLVVLSWVAPVVAGMFLAWLFLYGGVVVFFVKRKIPLDLAEAHADSRVVARYADTITNALTIKMFARRKKEYDDFKGETDKEERKRRRAWYFNNMQHIVTGILFLILEIAVVFFTIRLWLAGAITAGTIILIQAYLVGTFRVVWDIGRTLTELEKAIADANEMVEIFEKEPGVMDSAHPEICRITRGDIDMNDISFGYEEEGGVFQNFSLHIRGGEKVALVGESGAGKTTITKLLLRFADIGGGSITIDEQDISRIRQDDLRRSIAYVPQEPLLFHRSLKENIAYGNPNAPMEDVIAAAKKAHAHEFISRLRKGYDTLVGERGVKLSGGERQRVAIARAMLKRAPILILDEATSSLDSVSERYIQDALEELMRGKTVIVVAHRLSTIRKMDRVVVLDRSGIAEDGSHTELLERGGAYASLWKQQTQGFIA